MKKLILALLLTAGVVSAQKVDTLIAAPPQAVSALTTAVIGTPGGTSGCYWAVAKYTGGSVLSVFPSCLTNIPNTLTSGNKVQINFGLVANATSYDVVKTATSVFPQSGTCTTCLVATGLTSGITTDIGSVLSSYTLAGFANQNTQTTLQLNQQDYVTPTVELVNAAYPFTDSAGFIGLLSFNGVPVAFTHFNVVLLSEVNAGKIILPAVAGKTLRVVGVQMLPTGTFGGCTAVVLQDTNGVNVFSEAIAGLVNNVDVNETSANTTLSNYGNLLTLGAGLQIVKTGASCTTATSVLVIVSYTVR